MKCCGVEIDAEFARMRTTRINQLSTSSHVVQSSALLISLLVVRECIAEMNAIASRYAAPSESWTSEDVYFEQSLNDMKYELPNLANPSSFLKTHTDEYGNSSMTRRHWLTDIVSLIPIVRSRLLMERRHWPSGSREVSWFARILVHPQARGLHHRPSRK